MKIKEMSKEQLTEYHKNKVKEWRQKNPEKNKEQRKKYKQSQFGKASSQKYEKKYRNRLNEQQRIKYRNDPVYYKQKKEYINDYLKKYMLDREHHRKYLIRMKDYRILREKLLKELGYCQLCGSKENLEIHHKSYDENKNVILLCRKCHRKLHWKY